MALGFLGINCNSQMRALTVKAKFGPKVKRLRRSSFSLKNEFAMSLLVPFLYQASWKVTSPWHLLPCEEIAFCLLGFLFRSTRFNGLGSAEFRKLRLPLSIGMTVGRVPISFGNIL